MKSSDTLYIKTDCYWQEVIREKRKYIKIQQISQGRVIYVTDIEAKIWRYIDKGYKINKIMKRLKNDRIKVSKVLMIIERFCQLKLVTNIKHE